MSKREFQGLRIGQPILWDLYNGIKFVVVGIDAPAEQARIRAVAGSAHSPVYTAHRRDLALCF